MRRAFSTSSSTRGSFSSIHCCAIMYLASLDSSRLSQRLSHQGTTGALKPSPSRITAATTDTWCPTPPHWRGNCRAQHLEHVRNIGGAGGIGKQHLLQLCGAHATAYDHGKNIND